MYVSECSRSSASCNCSAKICRTGCEDVLIREVSSTVLECWYARFARLLSGDTNPHPGREVIVKLLQGATSPKARTSLCHCDVPFVTLRGFRVSKRFAKRRQRPLDLASFVQASPAPDLRAKIFCLQINRDRIPKMCQTRF